jgi:hypothetical protein
MEIDFFLWPILLPLILLVVYAIVRHRKVFRFSILLLVVEICIVILYWPLISLGLFSSFTYIFVKYLLFIFIPLLLIVLFTENQVKDQLLIIGLGKKGLKRSMIFFLLFLPVMFIVSGVVTYLSGNFYPSSLYFGVLSFFESFSEEFFFRGVLFLVLLTYVDIRLAYVISLASFILVHPQHLTSLFILPTVVQGILTLEIVRRSNNLVGAWFLHGVNRIFLLLVIPFLLG